MNDDGTNLGNFWAINLKAATANYAAVMLGHPKTIDKGNQLFVASCKDRLWIRGDKFFDCGDVISDCFSNAHRYYRIFRSAEARGEGYHIQKL